MWHLIKRRGHREIIITATIELKSKVFTTKRRFVSLPEVDVRDRRKPCSFTPVASTGVTALTLINAVACIMSDAGMVLL